MVPAMRPAYLIDGLRSPFGRYGGALGGVRADDLAAQVIAVQKALEAFRKDMFEPA